MNERHLGAGRGLGMMQRDGPQVLPPAGECDYEAGAGARLLISPRAETGWTVSGALTRGITRMPLIHKWDLSDHG